MTLSLTTRQKIVAALCFLLVLASTHVIMVKVLSHQTKAVVLRAEFVVGMETILVLMSMIIWHAVSPFLKPYTRSSVSLNDITSKQNGISETPFTRTSKLSVQGQKGQISHLREHLSFSKVILLVYLFLCHTSYLTNLFFISKEPHWFAMLAYICLGSYIQLVTCLVIGNTLYFIVNKFSKSAFQNRKDLGKKIVVTIAVIYTAVASIFGVYTASLPPGVRHVKIPIKDIPTNLNGLSVVQISDIHLGPTVGFTKLNVIVDIVNGLNPDMVVLTGDLVDGRVGSLRKAAEPLSRIISTYGNFFVTGNHEYYTGDVDNWFSYLRSLGFRVLHNSNVKIPMKVQSGEGQLCLAGTDDVQADSIGYDGHGFDLAAALDGCLKDQPVILMAHQPRAAKKALDSDHRIDLVLSGHTHGGQLFPLQLGAYILNPFYRGLYQYGPQGSHVYVSEGTQYWGIPMRIGTSTEITHITLTRAANQ